MSGQTMNLLNGYRDRIVECADELADTFSKDKDLAIYAAGVKLGADLLMYAGLCDGIRNFEAEDAASQMMVYTAFMNDMESIGKAKGGNDEGNAEADDPRALADAS